MGRCETCQHWEKTNFNKSRFGYCRMLEHSGRDELPKRTGTEIVMIYADDMRMDIGVECRADFGCVMHEERQGEA